MKIRFSHVLAVGIVAGVAGWMWTGTFVAGGMADSSDGTPPPAQRAQEAAEKPFRVAVREITSQPRRSILVIRGRTEADARVEVRAETGGTRGGAPGPRRPADRQGRRALRARQGRARGQGPGSQGTTRPGGARLHRRDPAQREGLHRPDPRRRAQGGDGRGHGPARGRAAGAVAHRDQGADLRRDRKPHGQHRHGAGGRRRVRHHHRCRSGAGHRPGVRARRRQAGTRPGCRSRAGHRRQRDRQDPLHRPGGGPRHPHLPGGDRDGEQGRLHPRTASPPRRACRSRKSAPTS